MNQHIKDILDVHGIERLRDFALTGPVQRAAVEYFVDLIVKECAAVVMREDHDPSKCILNHFGVE